MFSRLPWRVSALLPLLCLLLITPTALTAQIDSDDVVIAQEIDNIVTSISAIAEPNCHSIKFRANLDSRIRRGTTFRWTITDDTGTQTTFVTTTQYVVVPVPALIVNLVVCEPSLTSLCTIIGFGTASIPPLSTFVLTPNFNSYATDGNITISVNFFGNRCFGANNIFASFLPGSTLDESNIVGVTANPSTFGTNATIRINASGEPIGTQNFLFVQVNSDPFGELATAVYQIRVVPCCISAEAPEEEAMTGTFGSENADLAIELQELVLPTDLTTRPASQRENFAELFPNPARTSVTVRLREATEVIRILTVNGQEAKRIDGQQSGGSSLDIDISTLPSGIYFIEVQSVSGLRTLKRLSVAR